jgi:hypothetical protein
MAVSGTNLAENTNVSTHNKETPPHPTKPARYPASKILAMLEISWIICLNQSSYVWQRNSSTNASATTPSPQQHRLPCLVDHDKQVFVVGFHANFTRDRLLQLQQLCMPTNGTPARSKQSLQRAPQGRTEHSTPFS